MSDILEQSFKYYLSHQAELVQAYNGKVIAIAGTEVVGAYDDARTAVQEAQKRHPLGTFIVQRVSPGEEAYTQTFHSRVVFA